MKKILITVIALGLFFIAFPVCAENHYAVGLGVGMGDNDVGPADFSAKFYNDWLEVGAEVMYDGDKDDAIDQLALAWLMYRQVLHHEENNSPWMGAGFGYTFEADSYEDNFGFVSAMGWDGKGWGLELKFGYFDPSLYSFAVYYQLD